MMPHESWLKQRLSRMNRTDKYRSWYSLVIPIHSFSSLLSAKPKLLYISIPCSAPTQQFLIFSHFSEAPAD
jgi:hypothetical protein